MTDGRITLLFDIEVSGPSSVKFSVHRGKNFVMPSDMQLRRTVMELELTAVIMGYRDIVDFWKEKGMLNEKAAAGMMAKSLMDALNNPQNTLIESIPENMAELVQKRNPDDIMKILKG